MSSGPAQQLWDVFEQVVQLPPDEQGDALAAICGGDEALRTKVAGMLAADRRAGSFIDQPIGRGLQDLDPAGGSAGDSAGDSNGEPNGDPSGSAARLQPGSRIGNYRVIRLLAEGGMGSVYLAARDDDSFSRQVALKVVRGGMTSGQILERLKTERRILAGLSHPYISRLYDGGSTPDGQPYFVLEYIEGEAIDAYCRKNALSIDERLALFVKVCQAVQYAHQNLVVHRDLKPGNILVTPDGDPRLLDFGIAKLVNPDLAGDGADLTDPILRVATPNYASPEQLRGDLITTSSDVYSLGVLLYKLLTGHLPHSFSGLTLAEIESRLESSTPLPPSAAVSRPVETPDEPNKLEDAEATDDTAHRKHPKLASDLDAIVLKALRTVPRQRYSSVEGLADDIERFRHGLPVLAHAGSWRYRARKFVRRHRAAVATAAAVALLLVGFTIAFALQARRVAAERDAAQLERDKKAQVLNLVLDLFRLSSPYVEPGQELTVRDAVERSLGTLGDSLADQPAVRAELLQAVGTILLDLGVNDAARDHFSKALELQRQVYGEDHPALAATTSALAASEKDLGELGRAEELARRALDLARVGAREAGADAEQATQRLANSMNELVSVLCYQSEYENAEQPAREVLELTAKLPAEGSPRIVALEQLARIRDARGDHREAVALDREAVALRRRQFGEMHPGQLGTLNNLGSSLRRSGELDAAETAYGEALDIYRFNFGGRKTSRVLPALLNNLATVAFDRGNFELAERSFLEARKVVAETMGADHVLGLHLDIRLARVHMRLGDPDVEATLRRLIEVWQPRLGADHWRLHEARGVLGETLSFEGRCDEAEPLLIESFERLLDTAGANAKTAALDRLREHFERCGRTETAIEPFAVRLESTSDT